jgi:hypothetical protein
VVVKVVDLTIGTCIEGVFVDMHEIDVIKWVETNIIVARFEEGEKMLVVEVERVEANIIEPRCWKITLKLLENLTNLVQLGIGI